MIHSCGRMTSSFRSKGPAASSPRRSAVRFRSTTLQSSPHAARPTSASTTRKFSSSSASARMKSTACGRVAPFRKQRSARRSAMPAMTAQTMSAVHTGSLWRIASARMPTKWGMFDAIGFERDVSNGRQRIETALAIVMGDPTEGVPLLRFHSQGFTGEVQDGGLETVEANHALGLKADYRDFSLPAAILRDLGITRVRLLSNNPRKASALARNGVELVVHLSCEAAPTEHSSAYLRTKKERMGHVLNLRKRDAAWHAG